MADRWATFDCYGTLIDWNGGIGSVLGAALRRVRAPGGAPAATTRSSRGSQAEQYRTYREVLDLVTAELAAEEDRELGDGERTAMSESLASWPAFPEVPAALAERRSAAGGSGILSNCDRDLLARRCRGWASPLTRVVVPRTCARTSPRTGHWQAFFEQHRRRPRPLTCTSRQACSTTSPPADDQGMPSVWVNRLGETARAPPDARAADLAPLPDVLDELVARVTAARRSFACPARGARAAEPMARAAGMYLGLERRPWSTSTTRTSSTGPIAAGAARAAGGAGRLLLHARRRRPRGWPGGTAGSPSSGSMRTAT